MWNILEPIRFIFSHPLTRAAKLPALVRYLKWQVGIRILGLPCVFPFAGGTHLFAAPGLHSATGNYYVGLLAFEEMAFVLHFLREDDLFVDVGANIGAFSVLASGVRGARSHAFEPAPASCEWLEMNLKINGLEPLITLTRCAVGAQDGGTVKFVENGHSSLNHIIRLEESAPCVEIPVVSLDAAIKDKNPALIKIDVEGFETCVLDGAERLLSSATLKALIIELRGHGARYGFDESVVLDNILAHGFVPCAYDPFTRDLTVVEKSSSKKIGHQEIFCRDLEYVRGRLATAPVVGVLHKKI